MITLKSPREIEKMRDAGRIVYEVLDLVRSTVAPGITTRELDQLAFKETGKRNAKPAFKGYHSFPASLCCSLNNQVVHGIPNDRPLQDGDILSIDFGVYYNGYYGDSAVTVSVGNVADSTRKLLKVTEESLLLGIESAVAGGRLYDISAAVQQYVEGNGFSIVRDYVGHGIGKNLHEEPQIPNFGKHGTGVTLKPGMVLAIEPMVNQFGHDVQVLEDGWTVITCDGGLSAHFEHTVAITEHGPDILTRP